MKGSSGFVEDPALMEIDLDEITAARVRELEREAPSN